jgi:hypothetical protein
MDADDILAKVKDGAVQAEDWPVFPLLRNKMIMSI